MLEEVDTESAENNILYELLIYAEWLQDPEAKFNTDREDNVNEIGYVQKWLDFLVPESCPPNLICQLTNLQMPWTFAIGGNGAVIAILQDSFLEIRTSRDEYGAVIGRTTVSKDLNPQWRRILWSPDCTLLALAHSDGKLDFYDLIGAHVFTIENNDYVPANGNSNFRFAIAGMAFSEVRTINTQWSYEFLVANYQGIIKGYYISPSDGFQESHTFSLSSCYPFGISCFMYNPLDNILIVCGKSQKLSDLSSSNDAYRMGMSSWRMISGPPHYKLTLSIAEQMVYSKTNWWTVINQYKPFKSSKQDLVFKMSISPNGKILAAIHESGALSLWDLPTLRLKKFWELQLQPNYADINPQFCEPGMKKKSDNILGDAFYSHIIDINWWSDEAVIMVRRCGAVTVSSINSLKNLLGISPEWFEPSPAVTSFCDRGFLAMESEVQVKNKRRKVDDTQLEEDDNSSEDEEPSIFAQSAQFAKRALFFITDSDRFQPPRKKIKMISKTYRLLCLKSTTPEELYTRKINNEEYGEALALAKTYNLDCDLVYQRQWRKMPATVESINDYLSKITKRSWVLHECLERVPESFEAAKELLMFGLLGTDVKALIAIGKGEDHGRFIIDSSSFDDMLEKDEGFVYGLSDEFTDIYEAKKKYEEKRRLEMLKKVNFQKLTLEQKQLCQCRLKLLAYLDRLLTYEVILGGSIQADELYDHNFFKKFRSQCGLESAIYFACNSNWEAVAALFTYHGSETLSHRLAILKSFPETASPMEYRSLLPLFNEHELVFYPWDEHQLRDPDWCESRFQKIACVTVSEDYVEEFYEKHKELIKYRQTSLDCNLVTEWFVERAKEIEEKTGLVDNALELIKLGIQRNIPGLEKLYDDLITLDILIYECLIKRDICLEEYQSLTEFDKVKLMMSTTSETNFIKNLEQWLLPFLNRADKHDPSSGKALFKSYILSISKIGLEYCKKLLEHFKSNLNLSPIITDVNDLITLGLDCVYYCESTDELKNAKVVYDLLSSLSETSSNHRPTSLVLLKLQNDIEKLKRYISVAELLSKNGLPVTLSLLQNISENAEEVKKVLTKLTRTASHRYPALDEPGWLSLLGDILDMHHLLFLCISEQDCYEIVLQSLLCSGKIEGITLAGKMMECNHKQKKKRENVSTYSFKLPYSKSVKLVLAASQEYFNSSANASDPCMALARNCLNLIEDVPASIEEELDLISSVSLLDEFNVHILPLQVRLCENKISLVQEALQKNERSYKKSEKLKKLAFLLRAWSENSQEREGKVLTLIGERAFQAKDYSECFSACKKLMDGTHKEGWLICYTLGSCDEFSNLQARCDLMSFGISYCSDDLIETILKRRSELQLQILQARVKYLVGDDAVRLPYVNSEVMSIETEKELKDSKNALWQTSEKTFQALQATSETTKAVLTSVKSVQFWKDAVNWIQPLGLSWNEETSVVEDGNKNLSKQGISAFYDGLFENVHISLLEANYERYARPDLNRPQEIAFSILRACLIEDSLKFEGCKSCIENSVLLDMSKAYLPEDIMISLSILLSLKEPEQAETLFRSLPSTPVVLQFASLFFAIKFFILTGISPLSSDNEDELDPSNIIKKALETGKSEEYANSKQCQKLYDLLKKYDKMLYDFIQAEVLHSIGGGVDATRFTNDDEYKKDTILGISMTLDDSIFNTAVSLAHHYNLSVWDLYMTHLEFLFSEGSVSAAVISERTERLNLQQKLLEQRKRFENKLRNCIYPAIHGKDHDKLSLCFSFLEACGDNEDKFRIKPSLHKTLLSKFRSAMKNVDYKLIMDPESSYSYLTGIINESNVHVFAKVADNIPKQNGHRFEPGNMYCIWLQKFFFDGNSSLSKIPTTKTEWIHRYESCTDMLQRLGPIDVIEFIDAVIFSETALEKMNIDSRSEVVKRAIKFSRMKCSKNKVLNQEWSSTVSILTGYYQHLQGMEDETIQLLLKSYDPKVRSYCKDFDLSKSSVEKLQFLLARIVIEGPDLQLLKNFLSCCPENINMEPSDAYIKAIHIILSQMKEPQSLISIFKSVSPLHILENVLEDISNEKDELMVEDLAVEILNEFCQDSSVSVSVRLGILQLLEKSNCLCPEYGDLLLLYRTQAIVSTVWSDLEISEEEVKDEFERRTLFNNLVSLSNSVTHFDSLAKLLSYWPPLPFKDSEDIADEPWTKLLSALVSLGNRDALNTAVNILEKSLTSRTFSKEGCLAVFSKIKSQGSILHTLKYALKTEFEELCTEGIQLLMEVKEITNEDYDDELLDLLLKHNITAQIISTGLYKHVIEYLLHSQDDNIKDNYKSIDTVVKELYEAGYEFEAGTLLHIKHSTHMGLSTFSSASLLLKRWLSETKS